MASQEKVNVFQIFLSDLNEDLSPELERRSNSIKQLFFNSNYKLFKNDDLREFIKTNYKEDVLWAYDKLIPYSYKADLGRFCLINTFGGWYVDIGMSTWNKDLNFENINKLDMIVFTDIQQGTLSSWGLYTTPFYSKPNNPVLEYAIELIVENCKTNYYGRTQLCPTGPNLFGRAMATKGHDMVVVYGTHMQLTPTFKIQNYAVVLPDGFILIYGKNNTGGDLTNLGTKSTNNYGDLWRAKNIYKDI